MIVLHMTMDPVLSPKKSVGVTTAPAWGTRGSEEAVVAPELDIEEPKEGLVGVLERAASDPDFIARLTYQGSKALQDYDLTLEEEAALLSGDINWIEAHVGKLDERLSTWLWCRLQQETW
jgi:hypothetical protein